jgi:hypothetical protein
MSTFNPKHLGMSTDSMNQAFLEAVNHLIHLYNDDMLDECAEGAEELLKDYDMPRYFRMKVLIMLANIQIGWEPAEDYLIRAENLWRCIRRANPEGTHAATDRYLVEIRDFLDDVKGAVEEQKFEEMEWGHDDTMEDSVVDGLRKIDDEVADARARLEGINFDADISNSDLMELDVKEDNRPATPNTATDPAVPPAAQGSGVNIQIIF